MVYNCSMNERKYVLEVKSAAYLSGWRPIAEFSDWNEAEFIFFAYAEKLQTQRGSKS